MHTYFDTMYIKGKVDFMCVIDDSLIVRDLKTGYLVPYNIKYQLYFYALAAIECLDWMPKHIHLSVHYREGEQLFKPTYEDLLVFKEVMTKKLQTNTFFYGSHCARCFEFKNCAFAHKQVKEFIDKKTNFSLDNAKDLIQNKPVIDQYYKTLTDYIKSKKDWDDFQILETKIFYWNKKLMPKIEKLLGCKKLPTPKEAKEMLDIPEDFIKDYTKTTVRLKNEY